MSQAQLQQVITRQLEIMELCAEHDIPVIVVESKPIAGSKHYGESSWETIEPLGTPVRDGQRVTVVRTITSPFARECDHNVGVLLASWNVTDILVVGGYGEHYVVSIALEARARDYRVVIANDAVMSVSPHWQQRVHPYLSEGVRMESALQIFA